MYKDQDMAGSIDVEDRKLFVGGLGWNANQKELNDYFSKYGSIESISVKTNPNTGRSRGFAFIVFEKSDSVNQILDGSEHFINGRKIDPKRAIGKTGKLFVGGLKAELSDDDIRKYFSQFGRIVDIKTPFDHHRNHRKGFCFITFEDEQIVEDLLLVPIRSINGVDVDLRKVMPKLTDLPNSRPKSGKGWDSGVDQYGGGGGGYYYDSSYSGYTGGYGNTYSNYDYSVGYDQSYPDGHGSRDSHQQSRYQPY